METNNDSPNPIREDDWDEAAEENYPQELTEVLQAADVAEQLEQAQEEEYTPDWDGTDAEFVEDEDAAEYEEQYAGIKLSYTLNREEAMAIRWHMGFSGEEDKRLVGQAFQQYPLAFALSVADMEATYFLENEEPN